MILIYLLLQLLDDLIYPICSFHCRAKMIAINSYSILKVKLINKKSFCSTSKLILEFPRRARGPAIIYMLFTEQSFYILKLYVNYLLNLWRNFLC